MLAGHILYHGEAEMGRYEQGIVDLNRKLDQRLTAYQRNITSGEERRMLDAVIGNFAAYRIEAPNWSRIPAASSTISSLDAVLRYRGEDEGEGLPA